MKQLRGFVALCIAGAVLAACSGGSQGVTPVTPGMTSQQPDLAAPVSLAGKGSGPVGVTAADRHFAATFQAGQAHVFYTESHMPHVVRPAVGYPADVRCAIYGGTCTTMPASSAINVYISVDGGKTCTTEVCWGHPEEFLKALAGTKFVGLITQYTKGAASGYKYGGHVSVKFPLYPHTVLYENDLFTILAAAAKSAGKIGTSFEYHLFIPPGVDTCFDLTTSCYSPDNPSTWAFCAYHSSAYVPAYKNFLVFSVEGYMNAKFPGCRNSAKVTSENMQASVLSHESFESWSDPVFNPAPLGYQGPFGEIGDICAYQFFTDVKGGGRTWNVQQEYSNAVHGCNNQ